MFPGAGVPSSSPLGLTASGTHPNEAGARCVQCPPHGADVAGEVSAPWPCSCGCCPVVTGEVVEKTLHQQLGEESGAVTDVGACFKPFWDGAKGRKS